MASVCPRCPGVEGAGGVGWIGRRCGGGRVVGWRGEVGVCVRRRDPCDRFVRFVRFVQARSNVSVAVPTSGTTTSSPVSHSSSSPSASSSTLSSSASPSHASHASHAAAPMTYEHHGNWNVGWFLKAVENIVRRLDGSPASDQFVHTVLEGVEAVIFVKRIVRRMDLDAHHISTVGVERTENRNALLAMAMAKVDGLGGDGGRVDGVGCEDRGEYGDHDGRRLTAGESPEQAEVEHVCQELLEASRARLVNSGRVGDCCDGPEMGSSGMDSGVSSVSLPASSSGSSAAASSSSHHPRAFHGFWGVVVQTKERSSVEGCYLLKAGCSVVERGCSCTHYTLTRVQEPTPGSLDGKVGERHAEYVPSVADQFVESWRQRRGGYDVVM